MDYCPQAEDALETVKWVGGWVGRWMNRGTYQTDLDNAHEEGKVHGGKETHGFGVAFREAGVEGRGSHHGDQGSVGRAGLF